MTPAIRFGSDCSGIEAASVAFGPLGWKAAWFSEIERFPSTVLAHHYPDVPNLGDMTALPERIRSGEVEAPDVFCGGTPCQAFSLAGARRSLDDARGNLSLVFCETANEIDAVRAVRGEPATIVFWENVYGVLSTKDNAFGCFLAGLAGDDTTLEPEPCPPAGKSSRYWKWSKKAGAHSLSWPVSGVVYGPQRTVAWRVTDAQYFGLAQRRRRVFVVASARDGFDPAAVLLEFDGLRRDTAPSREAGKVVAGTLSARTEGGGGLGTDFECTGGLQPVVGTLCVATGQAGAEIGAEIGADMAPTLNCNHEAPYIASYLDVGRAEAANDADIAHTLRGEGFDGSEDGAGRGTPLVAVGVRDCAPMIGANYGKQPDNSDTSAGPMLIAMAIPFDTTQITSAANYSNPKQGDPCHPLAAGAHAPAIAFSSKDHGGDATEGISPTLRAMGHAGSHANGGGQMAVCFAENSRAELRLDGGDGQRTGALSTGGGKPGQGTPMVAIGVSLRGREGGATAELGDEVGNCLRASGGGGDKAHVLASMAVRRLTPRECERLQGFQWRVSPDYPGAWEDAPGQWWSPDYTLIPGKARKINPDKLDRDYIKYLMRGGSMSFDECCQAAADGPRYKALGNSWAINNVAWIGRRIDAALHRLTAANDAGVAQ